MDAIVIKHNGLFRLNGEGGVNSNKYWNIHCQEQV